MLRTTFVVCGVACWLLYGWHIGVFPTSDCTDDVRGGVPCEECDAAVQDSCRARLANNGQGDDCKIKSGTCLCSAWNWEGCTQGNAHPRCKVNLLASGCGGGSCKGNAVGTTCGDYDGVKKKCSQPKCTLIQKGNKCGIKC